MKSGLRVAGTIFFLLQAQVFFAGTRFFCRHKWEAEEEIMFDTEEEAIIAQNIIEEVLGSV